MGEIEAKSELVREQDREYSRVQAAHEQMSANLAIAASENRQHTARINQLEAEARRDVNNRRLVLLCVSNTLASLERVLDREWLEF